MEDIEIWLPFRLDGGSIWRCGWDYRWLSLVILLIMSFRFEDQIGGAVGITEESLAFATNIAHHPQTWLAFPLSEEDDIDGLVVSICLGGAFVASSLDGWIHDELEQFWLF